MGKIYYKSVRIGNSGEFELSTSDGKESCRRTSQLLTDILRDKKLIPNTNHPTNWTRLSTSRISYEYPGTYRKNGILFLTRSLPDFCIPFDLMALTRVEDFESSDHEAEFLPGYDRFIFDTYREMKIAYPTSKNAVAALNRLRTSYDLKEVNPEEMQYNECCFKDKIQVTPVALIGDSSIGEIARAHNLVYAKMVDDYIATRSPLGFDPITGNADRFLDDLD